MCLELNLLHFNFSCFEIGEDAQEIEPSRAKGDAGNFAVIFFVQHVKKQQNALEGIVSPSWELKRVGDVLKALEKVTSLTWYSISLFRSFSWSRCWT